MASKYTGHRPLRERTYIAPNPYRPTLKYADTVPNEANEEEKLDEFKTTYRVAAKQIKPEHVLPENVTKLMKPTMPEYSKFKTAEFKSSNQSAYRQPPKQDLREIARRTESGFVGRKVKPVFRKTYTKPSYSSDYGGIVRSTRRSTSDLMRGTTIESKHIPGYCGHIPAADLVPTKVKNETRDVLEQRNLSLEVGGYKHNGLGYTGHNPKSFANDQGRARDPTARSTFKTGLRTGLVVPSMNFK